MEDFSKYYDILEIPHGSPPHEIRHAYQHLKLLYSSNSIAVSSMLLEFPEESKQHILAEIEEAYHKLMGIEDPCGINQRPKERPSMESNPAVMELVAGIETFGGADLRRVRESLGLDINNMAAVTRIKRQYIDDMECERFDALPAAVYLRGYVSEYARYLGLDYTKVASDYMKKYKDFKGNK